MDLITRLFIAAVSSVAGSLGGLFFSKRLKARAEYYDALIRFINHILSEVRFRKNPIKAIVQDFMNIGETPLTKNLSEYSSAADPKNPALSRGVLKPAEAGEIKLFLSSLGTLDSETQVFELDAYKEKFSLHARKTADRREKFSSMYVKLGFFAGLAAGILIL